MAGSLIIPGLMLFFSTALVAAAAWVALRLVPVWLEDRAAARAALHGEALAALATALSQPQTAAQQARLEAQYRMHRAALLALRPTARVPEPRPAAALPLAA